MKSVECLMESEVRWHGWHEYPEISVNTFIDLHFQTVNWLPHKVAPLQPFLLPAKKFVLSPENLLMPLWFKSRTNQLPHRNLAETTSYACDLIHREPINYRVINKFLSPKLQVKLYPVVIAEIPSERTQSSPPWPRSTTGKNPIAMITARNNTSHS